MPSCNSIAATVPSVEVQACEETVCKSCCVSYIDRAITIFMISFDPPKILLMRLSRYMRAMG